MNSPRISSIPKRVIYLENKNKTLWYSTSLDGSKFAPIIKHLTNCIRQGQLIDEKYYRQTTGIDYLLQEQNWIHLHIDPDGDDDALLWVQQNEHAVVFIGISTHDVFNERPRAESMKDLVGPANNLLKGASQTAQGTKTQSTPTADPPIDPPKHHPTRLTFRDLKPKPPIKEGNLMRRLIDIVLGRY